MMVTEINKVALQYKN